MVDEVTGSRNIKQLVLCFELVDADLYVHKDFVGIHTIEIKMCDTIVVVVNDVLTRFIIPLSNCRGQCCDGESNMTGHKKGVEKQILEESPFAFLTHCYGML